MVIDNQTAPAPLAGRSRKIGLVLSRAWRVLFGMILCQAPVTAVLVLGWSYRFLQREAFRCWYRQARTAARTEGFAEFAADNPGLSGVAQWPNWIIGQGDRTPAPAAADRKQRVIWYASDLLQRASGSLWTNLKTGVQALWALWMVTLPTGLLWLVAWWSGWNNSFNKGYEQAWVGPVIGVAAILLFAAVMFFVPMAQARQAVTGQWRAFFDLRLHWRLIAQRPGRYLGLTALIVLLSLPVIQLLAMPLAFPNWIDGYADLSHAQAMQSADGFYFFGAAYVLLAIMAVRAVAARVYALALLDGLNAGLVPIARLGKLERVALSRFNLLPVTTRRWADNNERRPRQWIKRGLRLSMLAVVPAIWISFAVLIFVTQFLNYDWVNWITQPLIHLPWLHRP